MTADARDEGRSGIGGAPAEGAVDVADGTGAGAAVDGTGGAVKEREYLVFDSRGGRD